MDRSGVLATIWQHMLGRFWYVHPRQMLLVRASPAQCLQTLALAAKPSTDRLHLRNLFSEGRRYEVQCADRSFRLHSTSRTPWRRRRGRIASVLSGTCSEISSGITRVDMRARFTVPFLLDVFVLPGWMSLLLLFGPLPLPVGITTSLILLGLSWLWHWYNAALQATDMVFFVQMALNDLPEAQIHQLPPSSPDRLQADFAAEWHKFYEDHRSR
jgi:hypothetical protein